MIPKPIITIERKCEECSSGKIVTDMTGESRFREIDVDDCESCNGIGQQKIEIYDIREFKCKTCASPIITFTFPADGIGADKNKSYIDRGILFQHKPCKGTGHIIPKELEPYEIKKVSEIIPILDDAEIYSIVKDDKGKWSNDMYLWFEQKHNLKEDDRIVIRKCAN